MKIDMVVAVQWFGWDQEQGVIRCTTSTRVNAHDMQQYRASMRETSQRHSLCDGI